MRNVYAQLETFPPTKLGILYFCKKCRKFFEQYGLLCRLREKLPAEGDLAWGRTAERAPWGPNQIGEWEQVWSKVSCPNCGEHYYGTSEIDPIVKVRDFREYVTGTVKRCTKCRHFAKIEEGNDSCPLDLGV